MNPLLDLFFHTAQHKILFESDARFKIIHKGRRFGLTIAFAFYAMYFCLKYKKPVLWIDTSYPNIKRYYERYFRPRLRTMPKTMWKFDASRYELKLGETYIDFRSATHPDNIEGFGYGLVIINEAGIVLKNPRIWEESVRPMMMEHGAWALIGGTPKGKRIRKTNREHPFYQLSARALERSKDGDTRWADFNFSSFDNPYIDAEEIREMERDTAPGLREQEIYGRFVDLGGEEILNRTWWKWYDEAPHFDFIFQSWDTALKEKETNDWSVCTTWGIFNRELYLLDLYRERVSFPKLVKAAESLIDRWRPNKIIIEDKSSGTSLYQVFREKKVPVEAITPVGDKVLRGHRASPYLERGSVHVPHGRPWVIDVVDECGDFPEAEHDDIYDTVTQAIEWAKPLLDRPLERPTGRRNGARRRGTDVTAGYD